MKRRGGVVNGLPGIAVRDLEQRCPGKSKGCYKRMAKHDRVVTDMGTSLLWENEWFGLLKEPSPELGGTGC